MSSAASTEADISILHTPVGEPVRFVATTGGASVIQSFEQSNLKQLNRTTDVWLVQLVDAADVRPDGSLEYYAPWDRPYDWTVSNDPKLLARTFGFFATDQGLAEITTYADGVGPWN